MERENQENYAVQESEFEAWKKGRIEMNVYEKLNAARCKFHGLELKKTGSNKFAGYSYFELGDFLVPALDVFKEFGLCASVSFSADVATMTIVNVEDTTQSIVITSPMGSAALKGCHEVQNIGAVETYQRRYLWVAAMEIVEHDALDASEPPSPIKSTKADLPESSKSITKSVYDALDAETRNDMNLRAMGVVDAFAVSDDAGFDEYMEAKEGCDADWQTAFWNLFDSKTRTKIKTIGTQRKEKQ